MSHAILTALGTDRPGLVDEISRFIFDSGGNIEDSRMVNLRGQFAIMLLVGGPDETLGKLKDGLAGFAKASGLHVEMRSLSETPSTTTGAARRYRLVATAVDQPGIVHRISHTLRQMLVNIESLETHFTPSPYTGAPLFEMELTLSVPAAVAVAQLRQNLAATCDALNVDWELRPI
jgi:glycine cleavage system transcriptional repressor